MLAKCSKLIHNGQEESRRHQDHEVSTTGKEISTTYAMKFTKMSMTSDTNESAWIPSATAKKPMEFRKKLPTSVFGCSYREPTLRVVSVDAFDRRVIAIEENPGVHEHIECTKKLGRIGSCKILLVKDRDSHWADQFLNWDSKLTRTYLPKSRKGKKDGGLLPENRVNIIRVFCPNRRKAINVTRLATSGTKVSPGIKQDYGSLRRR